MKKVILALSIASLSAYAQMQGGMMGQGGMMQGMGMMQGKMSVQHISKTFSSAENMAAEDIKSKVRFLKMSTLEKLIRQEAEVRIAHMNLHTLLMDSNSKDKDIEKQLKNLNEQENKLKEIAVFSLISLRKLIGTEKFGQICKKGHMGMMQMKCSSGKHKGKETMGE